MAMLQRPDYSAIDYFFLLWLIGRVVPSSWCLVEERVPVDDMVASADYLKLCEVLESFS